MTQYFYKKDDNKVGPVTKEQLVSQDIRASTLVWTKGMTSWTEAGKVDELSTSVNLSPPAFPKDIYDKSYQEDTEISVAGFLLLLLSVGWILFAVNHPLTIQLLIAYILFSRLLFIPWIRKTAKKQKRNAEYWQLLAFLSPSITSIILGRKKKFK
ncbi:MAG: DUF4339 domain-containing protein [Bacteroidota bacterium]|nr:DUF4339 domain-containing protein [Bacteroidota bacterium]